MTITWDGLTPDEQLSITAIFEIDQQQEKDERGRFARGGLPRLAEKWRWIDYATVDGRQTPLKKKISQQKRMKDEKISAIFESLEQKKLIERRMTNEDRDSEKASGDPILSIQITRAGRKLVRQALGLQSQWQKTRGLTSAQQRYADEIVAAGLAPRTEVESAFKAKSRESDDRIRGWGRLLKERDEQQYREYLKSLTRHEPCAYPGCSKTIEVRKLEAPMEHDEYPQPVRVITMTYHVPGWHDERDAFGKHRVRNTETVEHKLYACSRKHEEGIYRLRVGAVPLLLDEQEEQRLEQIRYPLEASQEALWEVIELATSTAHDIVAQATDLELVQTTPEMRNIAKQRLAQLLQTAETETFTDNLNLFTKTYVKSFVGAYKSGLTIRSSILERGTDVYKGQQRWRHLYEQREHM